MNSSYLPKWVFGQVYWDWKVWEVLANENINLLWFTGSSKTWKHLFKIAGSNFIKSIMELWGSNPWIIFEDADIDSVIDRIYYKRFLNCWQACNAIKRLIVHKSKTDEVANKLTEILKTKKVWNPQDKDTDIWSLVSKKQLDILLSQVQDAKDKWVNIIIWWKTPDNLQWSYYLPTILTNINSDMRVWTEEVFWPVLSIISFDTEEEAIKLANDTNYGLWAYVFTQDEKIFDRIASQLEAWWIELNSSFTAWCTPFGWYKDSWMCREHWIIWFRELCQVKTIAK